MKTRPARFLGPVPGFRGGIPEFPDAPTMTGKKGETYYQTPRILWYCSLRHVSLGTAVPGTFGSSCLPFFQW
ncbi:MAG TPA: hypothetical protein PLV96_07765 [Methanoregulaceae archaeon]|nr:hypothetical protein [Methanoregulaceae archaeon]